MLELEKEYIGVYLSGHPLNLFEQEIKNFCFENSSGFLLSAKGKPFVVYIAVSLKILKVRHFIFVDIF